MFKVGRVISTKDQNAGGGLRIQPVDDSGAGIGGEVFAIPCSPNLGDGYGFLSVPGKGALVLYTKIPPIKVKEVPPVVSHAWLGVIAENVPQKQGKSAYSDDSYDSDESNNRQKDPYGRTDTPATLYGPAIPEGPNMYADNLLPQQDIWKQKSGHKVVLSHKITKQGKHDNGITISNASGKSIRFDDGPPEMNMDRITLKDEKDGNPKGANRFEIISSGAKPSLKDSAWLVTDRDQNHLSHQGNQNHEITCGQGSQRRFNRGEGDITDTAAYGNHKITAKKDIVRLSTDGNITETAKKGDMSYTASQGSISLEALQQVQITCGESTITITPGSISLTSPVITVNGESVSLTGTSMNITGDTGDVLVDETSLNLHTHLTPFFLLPTTAPIP